MRISKIKTICESKGRIQIIDIETDISKGLYNFRIIGNVNKTVSESKFRILSALRNTNFDIPQRKNYKVSISFLPIQLPKTGTYCDLAITISYLIATEQIHIRDSGHICCIGNVGIDGDIYVDEVDAQYALVYAYQQGIRIFIIPDYQFDIFESLHDIHILKIKNITDLRKGICFKHITSTLDEYTSLAPCNTDKPIESYAFSKIKNLYQQKRALIIALAGSHHILFTGQPGTGKSTLAQSAQELLDPMCIAEIPAKRIIGNSNNTNMFERSFREVPTNITQIQMIGNSHTVGEIAYAEAGVMLLNELCEFNKKTIESLRTHMDSDSINEQNNLHHESHPLIQKNIQIIATSNNCPCGLKTTFEKSIDKKCQCSPRVINQYQAKLSESIIDRFPLICNFNYIDHTVEQRLQNNDTESIQADHINPSLLISKARYIQRKRNQGKYNQHLTIDEIFKYGISTEASDQLESLKNIFIFSKRKVVHVLRVARTIADLAQMSAIEKPHITEAFSYVKIKPFG